MIHQEKLCCCPRISKENKTPLKKFSLKGILQNQFNRTFATHRHDSRKKNNKYALISEWFVHATLCLEEYINILDMIKFSHFNV